MLKPAARQGLSGWLSQQAGGPGIFLHWQALLRRRLFRGGRVATFLSVGTPTASEAVQMSYPNGMDHLEVLREKIGRLRGEIAHIQELNEQYRRRIADGTEAEVNGYKQSSSNLSNWQTLAAKFIRLKR
jgi:hypothetical protein